jgi:hypothetical protein
VVSRHSVYFTDKNDRMRVRDVSVSLSMHWRDDRQTEICRVLIENFGEKIALPKPNRRLKDSMRVMTPTLCTIYVQFIESLYLYMFRAC